MHAFSQYIDAQIAAGQAAQGCGAPELIIIGTSGIQANHQTRAPDAIGKMIDIKRPILTSGFLARFNQDDGAGMGNALGFQRGDGRQ